MSDESQEAPPTGDDTLPVLNTTGRRDMSWEEVHDPIRIALALDWAQPIQARVATLMRLGDTVDDNPEFGDLVDELYDGLRDRLTRQDLLWITLIHLAGRTDEDVDKLVDSVDEELEELDSSYGFQRHFGSS